MVPFPETNLMSKWKISFFITVLFILIISNPSFSLSSEDTVHLSFKRTAASNKEIAKYTVKRGDFLLRIIKRHFGGTKKENLDILRSVKRLNPQIKNPDIIHPGQNILLPGELTGEVISERREEESSTLNYTVKKGDSIIRIVRNELGINRKESYRLLERIRLLNPGIKNLNRIYPGQKIVLPFKGEIAEKKNEITQIKLAEKAFLSPENQLAVIKYIVKRTGGSVITTGNFYIPLRPSGQIGIDCSKVPVAELDDGKTALLDFSNRIPENVKKIIESTWKNYAIVDNRDGTSSVMKKLIDVSDMYSLKREGDYIALGDRVSVLADLVIEWRGQEEPYSFCINFVDESSSLLPGNIRRYAVKRGFEIIEISQKEVITDTGSVYKSAEIPFLNAGSQRKMVESLLENLGYLPRQDLKIRIFKIEEDGFNLSVKADFFIEADGKNIIMNFEKLPAQFSDILRNRGSEVIYLSEEESKREVIEKILDALGVSYVFDTFKFEFSERKGKKGGEISLPALKIGNNDGFIYLIDYEIDDEIYGLLHGKWEVKLIKY
jgi:LysM repeat protein